MMISICRDGQEIGAWEADQVRAFYEAGQLVSTDLYWHEGNPDWLPLRSWVKPPLPPGKKIVPLSVPTALLQSQEISPVTSNESLQVIGYKRRCAARMIDYFIMTLCAAMTIFVAFVPFSLLSPSEMSVLWFLLLVGYLLAVFIFYAWDFVWIRLFGASPGKLIYGLKVINLDGSQNVSNKSASTRAHALLQSLWYLVGFPYLTFWRAAYGEKELLKAGLTAWDKAARTIVGGRKIGTFRRLVATFLSVFSFLGILIWISSAMSLKH